MLCTAGWIRIPKTWVRPRMKCLSNDFCLKVGCVRRRRYVLVRDTECWDLSLSFLPKKQKLIAWLAHCWKLDISLVQGMFPLPFFLKMLKDYPITTASISKRSVVHVGHLVLLYWCFWSFTWEPNVLNEILGITWATIQNWTPLPVCQVIDCCFDYNRNTVEALWRAQ